MDFTIIGAGNMGRALAARLSGGGNSIVVMDRDDAEAARLADELTSVRAAPYGSPIETEAVILAVYAPSIPEIIQRYGDQLSGRIVIDISNALNPTFDDLAFPPDDSSAENTARLAPGAMVIKAFNTTLSGPLTAGQVDGRPLDVFIAGDDADAKARLSQAIAASGLRPLDAGPLKRARILEGIGFLHIKLQDSLGTNWGSAVNILP